MRGRLPVPADPTPGVMPRSVGRRRRRERPTAGPAVRHRQRSRSGPHLMDVSFLEPVFNASGPYATVCADVTHTTENADTEVELRVRALAQQLTDQGAPEAVVEAVRSRLLEANEGGDVATLRGRALVVAADGSVVLDQPLIDAPRRGWPSTRPPPTSCRSCGSCPDACRTSS